MVIDVKEQKQLPNVKCLRIAVKLYRHLQKKTLMTAKQGLHKES